VGIKLDLCEDYNGGVEVVCLDLSHFKHRFNYLSLKTGCQLSFFVYGWRLFFYSNENDEPIHVHAEKGDMECKFWILVDAVEIREEYSYN